MQPVLTPSTVVDAVRRAHQRAPLIGLTTPAGIADYRNDLARWLRGAGPAPSTWGPLPSITADRADLVRRAQQVVASEPIAFPLRTAVLEDLEQKAALLEACIDPDPARFTAYSREAHGYPQQETLSYARELLDVAAGPPEHTATAQDLADAVAIALRAYGLDSWWVELVPQHASRISVSRVHRRVRIQADASFSPTEIARLVVHEVGGHVLRSDNAESQPEPLAPLALGSTVTTEEGIASWLERWAGILDAQVLRTYAARVLATELSAEAGILEVAQELSHVVDADIAAAIATRAKRGLRDPAAAGGLTKDHGYLSGLLEVERLVEREGEGILPLLHATKWPLSMLPVVRTLIADGALEPAALLPDTDRLGIAGLVGHRTLA